MTPKEQRDIMVAIIRKRHLQAAAREIVALDELIANGDVTVDLAVLATDGVTALPQLGS